MPGVQALVAADGDVAAAQAALEGGATPAIPKALPPGPIVKGLLPPWKGSPVRNPPPGMSTGELAEEAALQPMRPTAKLLPSKVGGYDAHIGGVRIVESVKNTVDKAGNPIVKVDVALVSPDDAIQIKTGTGINKFGQPSTTPVIDLAVDSVKMAIKKAYTQPRTLKYSQIPGTNFYERVNVATPQKITIIVQVPGEVTEAMRKAAQKAVDNSPEAQAMVPPIEVIVQQEQ